MMLRLAAAAVGALALAGCADSKLDELKRYTEEIKAEPPGPLEPLPEVQQVDTFVFEPGNRRDPFVMDDSSARAAAPGTGGGLAPDPLRRKEELEQYPLDSLRMVGTLEQNETMWALIATPDGILHRVRVGNYMGQNNGQITRITENEIQLIEVVSDGPGDWRERQSGVDITQ
jgi:type IV pilus assembly protein PilP